ncbi:GntR family transcriptional regulator [Algirhabdus cladophorae]|uniref:GntR family transcriptional regulator n=1 Tax=Algirhabdus cladophorae TaxID=3377108 RepID=UPI003B84B52E
MSAIDETGSKETSATRGAYLTLRRMILTGALPAGEKLKIERLRVMLDTGSSPVREALSLLTSDMLVERIDQRGFRAAPVNKANFEEILMLRETLESIALRGSIANATSQWEDRLVLTHHRMKKAAQQKSTSFEEVHKAFHMALLENAETPMLMKYCSQLYDLNIRYRYLAAKSDLYQSRDVETEHTEILDAAVARDADAAIAALMQHYRRTGEYLTTLMDDLAV